MKNLDLEWLVDRLFDCQDGYASCRWTAKHIMEEIEKLQIKDDNHEEGSTDRISEED